MGAIKSFAQAIIVVTTVTAAVMELIDTTIVNIALNDMAGSLGVGIEDVSWVITSYAIANVIIIPLTGFLGQYFGRKNYYIASMILFTVASWFCGQSTGLVELILWRFMQGIGGGALLSTSQAILFDAFEPKDRPIASGLFGMGLVLGPTLGPTIGGYIIEHFSWPVIFDINVPIGIVATILSIYFVPKKAGEGEQKQGFKIDYLGIALLAAGIGCLQYVLERGEHEDWFDSRVIQITAVLALVGLVGFVWREFTTDSPAVNLKVLKNRNLAFTTIFTFVAGVGLFTSVFVYPVLAQRVLGFTAFETGISLLPPTLFAVMMMPVIGKVMSKGVSAVPFVVGGFFIFALYCWLSANVSPDVGKWAFFIPLAIRAVGISMVQLPLINQAVAGLEPKDYPAGIAINNMIRQLGGAFGIALANNYVTHQYGQHRSDLVSAIPEGSPQLIQRINILVQGIMSRTNETLQIATQKAQAILSMQVDRQSFYLAYLDTFRLIALFFLLVVPFAFFLKTKKEAPKDPDAARKALESAH